ncbi:hypothetical protein RRG08_031704 [Elysia crispata]|uniref:PDZ domain-containing protein n=1 Tax=Elysia crispata TaxID=231223 RepID=A0AAE1DFP9_9GAST|nr:hypothetical protein RRG08_031704 [Elysia crispata]
MSRLHVHLYRDSYKTPWGFRLQGGKDLNQPLTVQRVFSNSPSEGELQRGDQILSINNLDTASLTHKDAQKKIIHGGGQIELVIHRPPPGTFVAPLSPPIYTPRPRAPSLQSPTYYYSNHPSSVQYNQSPGYNTMNGDPYYGYRPDNPSNQKTYKSKPTYLQIQVNPPSHQKHNPQYQQNHSPHYNQPQQHQHQQYYLQQQPSRHRSSWSQPPVTPTTPTPPWASQQSAPKRVTKLSQLGGAGQSYGTTYATLPRSSSAQYGANMVHRPRPDFDPDEEREPDLPLATGPVPKVCSRRNLGGGGLSFGTNYGSHGRFATLPRRHDTGRRASQPPSLPSAGGIVYTPTKVSYGGPQTFGTDYGHKGYGQTPAQRYEPRTEKGVMLQRVQTTLDNITLSPRTPEAQPVFQPFSPTQQVRPAQPQPSQLSPQYRPQQVYTPTSLLLEHQQQQQKQQQQQYQQPQQHQPQQYHQPQQQYQYPQAAEEARGPAVSPKPKAPKPFSPVPAGNKYSTFSAPQQSNSVWRPSHQQPYSPGHQAPSLVHSAPPPWKRPEDDVDDSTPAWRSTLKSASGVKPWERDVDYQHQPTIEQSPRSVANNPASPTTQAPDTPGIPGGNRKVVHLQYNSPMQLYSKQNVAETYESHAKVLSPSAGDATKPGPGFNQAGDRDWSQSAVLQFLNQESKKSKRSVPAVAAKPQQNIVHYSPSAQQHQLQQPYYNDSIGASDF